MPERWVVRRNLDGLEESTPVRCFIEGAIVAEPGVRTVEQCIASLLREGEGCEGAGDQRPIRRAGQLLGVIEITRGYPGYQAT